MKTKILLVAALASAGIAASCSRQKQDPASGPVASAQKLKVESAQVRESSAYYVATGTVRGRNTAVLASKAMGYVKKLHAGPGDHVEKGQVLIELDARDARAELSRARAGIAEARASVAQAKQSLTAARASAALAKLSYERTKQLSAQDVVSRQVFDEAQAKHQAAEAGEGIASAGLNTARARVSQAEASSHVASSLLDYRKIVAPFPGRVVARSSETGDLAAPGQPLLVLEEEGALRVEAVVDESQAGRIAIGNTAKVEVDAIRTLLIGSVDEIVPAVDEASRAFVVKLRLQELAPGVDLRPGMFARVHFPVGETKRLMVPRAAVSARGQLDRLFVVSEGQARLRLVTLGAPEGTRVEVLSGLELGERYVVTPPKDLIDGAKIEATP